MSKLEFHFKVTTWEEVVVPEEQELLVLEAIKSGKVNSSSDIFDLFDSDGEMTCEPIIGMERQMSVEDNGGYSTIDVLNKTKDCEYIYKNGK